ncbi:MAG: 50S ribosomal protein L30 [SAR202 cluster bacterium Io17-Chloro-G2]|nr:MAG: 50S ribosomal protein L30 [SAR202 cluster bacterium Io17-Chloro-G2]
MTQLKITWKKSCIGCPENQRRIIKSLGLHRLNHSVIHADTPSIRGMIDKVPHLVSIEAVE